MAEKNPSETITYRGISIISQDVLKEIWGAKFCDKPFPKVTAVVLANDEFERVGGLLRKLNNIKVMDIKEYGRETSPETNVALVYPTTDGYRILVKRFSYYPLNEILEHELMHIYKGDT